MAIPFQSMATTTVKSTYSLDIETATAIESLGKRWQIPKSQVIRRVVRAQAAALEQVRHPTPVSVEAAERVAAFQALSGSLHSRGVDLRQWAEDITQSRR